MTGRKVGLLSVVVVLCLAGLGCETVPKKQYDDLYTQWTDVRSERDQLRTELAGARGEKASAEAELARLRSNAGSLPPGFEAGTTDGRPAIKIPASLLYASGQSQITPAGESGLRKVASLLKAQYPEHEIRVEGHTDADPINLTKDKYKDNWDLGASRANEVLRFLVSKGGIDPKKVYSASYAYYRSVPGNKAAQRRVEIVVLAPITATPMVGTTTGEPEEK